MATDSTASGTNIVVQANGNYQRQKWVLEKLSDPPEGVLLYDTETGLRITNPTRYITPGETVSLADLQLEAAAYSGMEISQSFSWFTNDDEGIVDVGSSGIFTGISAGQITVKGTSYSTSKDIEFTLIVTLVKNGTYYIKNRRFDTYVDIQDQEMSNGTTIHQWEFHGGSSQKWKVMMFLTPIVKHIRLF